jgi:hypothetical protein
MKKNITMSDIFTSGVALMMQMTQLRTSKFVRDRIGFVKVQGWVRDGILHQLILKLLNREPRTLK